MEPDRQKVEDIKTSIKEKFDDARKFFEDAWDGIETWFNEHVKDPLVKVSEKIAEKFQWLFDLKDSVGGFVAKVIHRGEEVTHLKKKPIKKDSKEKKLVPNQLLITFLLNLHQIII